MYSFFHYIYNDLTPEVKLTFTTLAGRKAVTAETLYKSAYLPLLQEESTGMCGASERAEGVYVLCEYQRLCTTSKANIVVLAMIDDYSLLCCGIFPVLVH